ncbi:protein of unknown function [Butyrivibrio sp. ob235]|uniref:Kiwa anti-phage protein KwaB-like domain-containing protein n=1 Tax=Butyrivibrio sp. ob235 TaxID=1761780 RepID=UPI0008CCBCC0|nr:Kiwa anti-phage protein KwaB-like domain-containing protein [Butyrivibrio sp. ob235]SEL98376.1 protein of unknown function [Butyrivibrio sp. ob235]
MFDNCCIFILTTDNSILRLEVDKDTQKTICDTFRDSVETMVNGKAIHDFEVNYKPEDDEVLRIEKFLLPDEIKDAIRNPLGVDSYEKDNTVKDKEDEDFMGYPEIKAIFVGECVQNVEGEHFNIGFQRYRKEQNLTALPFRLFHTNNTFKPEKHFGIGITYNVDCFYTGEELQFTSFYYARQVFDLRKYYRSASDSEVRAFTQNDALRFENIEAFNGMANIYVRRKIAMINDSEVLKNFTVKEIKSIAKDAGIHMKIKDKKIVIPADKDGAMEVLAFLDEEAYRGPFTHNLLIANSKRVLRKA